MMATTATHKLGDISRDEPDLCLVHGQDGDDYLGNWVTGFGYINVRFPMATTRELTEEDKARYDGAALELSGRPWGQIHIGGEPA
jgi:hypothetical protein